MRSKADETFVIVETLICSLQISHQAIELIAFFLFFRNAVATSIRDYRGISSTPDVTIHHYSHQLKVKPLQFVSSQFVYIMVLQRGRYRTPRGDCNNC